MSSHLDLEEQEQLDELKHFWKQYGHVITWILIAVMGAMPLGMAINIGKTAVSKGRSTV